VLDKSFRMKRKSINIQRPGRPHVFPCGCSGILPISGSNKFACKMRSSSATCRVSGILLNSKRAAKVRKHAAINSDTPHSAIRQLMKEELCWRCRKPIQWSLGRGVTPHLHHNHENGEIYGFTHSRCNPNALEKEIDRLKILLDKSPEL